VKVDIRIKERDETNQVPQLAMELVESTVVVYVYNTVLDDDQIRAVAKARYPNATDVEVKRES